MLISETHSTEKTYINIPNFDIYYTNHPDNKAHGGTAIIIKRAIKCVEMDGYKAEHIQATTVCINTLTGPINISAVYCPPKYNNTKHQYLDYLKSVGNRYLAGGDYNAKHVTWGSRITTTKGRHLYEAIKANNNSILSTGEPTYWPTDTKKLPDLIDFCITKNLTHENIAIKSCLDLSSDHSPLIITLQDRPVRKTITSLYNHKTNWNIFRDVIKENMETRVSLKSSSELDNAIVYLNDNIIKAVTQSTPILDTLITKKIPAFILDKIKQKRKLRKDWQRSKHPADKAKLNKSSNELKKILQEHNDNQLKKYLSSLETTTATNYSLWKATKKLTKTTIHKPPIKTNSNTWARTSKEKAETLADHFKTIFTNSMDNKDIDLPNTIENADHTIQNTTKEEIKYYIKKLKDKKTPGYDQINGKILKELPDTIIKYIRDLFNGIIRLQYFPKAWKVAQVIAIPKPNKNATVASSYRPISLLPILSKLFEKILLDRIAPILKQKDVIPSHQFGFRKQHSTVQQIHRVVNKITDDFDKKKYCIAVYLDIAKAFDRVWHKGLLYKLKTILPLNIFNILKSYMTDRHFFIKYDDECSVILTASAGVPQGSVLGPILYLVYTADIPTPTTRGSMIATFADDTVLMSANHNEEAATKTLQDTLSATTKWFEKWGIEVNKDKTQHVIYAKRKSARYPIQINGEDIKIHSSAKYLGITIDSKLTWKKHILNKRNEMKNKFRQLYWLLGKQSTLSLLNKQMIYKSIIRPTWTYGLEIWGTASKSNLQIIQRSQSKMLRTITNANWYIKNDDIHRDLGIDTVTEAVKRSSSKHILRLLEHKNHEMRLIPEMELKPRRLKRKTPTDLARTVI